MGVMFRMLLRSMAMMIVGMQRMTMGGRRVVRGLLMIAGFSVLGGFTVMLGGVLVVFRRLGVMVMNFVLRHGILRVCTKSI